MMSIGFLISCKANIPEEYAQESAAAHIYPDYSEVTVPANIAPLHFRVDENGDDFRIRLKSGKAEYVTDDSQNMIEEDEWKEMLEQSRGKDIEVEIFREQGGKWSRFAPFKIHVAKEEIDPFLSYRLIAPSYVDYEDLTINQRNLTSFDESIIYSNMLISSEGKGQCINCHSYQNYSPDNFQFHARQEKGGTFILCDGKAKKVDLKRGSAISSGVYPAWHPTEKLIAYSTNNTGQSFHTKNLNKVEVMDSQSDLILYDVKRDKVTTISAEKDEFEVFPAWSPSDSSVVRGL